MKIFVAMPCGEVRNSFIPQNILEKLERMGKSDGMKQENI